MHPIILFTFGIQFDNECAMMYDRFLGRPAGGGATRSKLITTGIGGPVNRSSRNRDLLVAYHSYGDQDARERVIEENLPLVRSLAVRFAGRGEPIDDLVQVGSIGLIKSVDRFRLGQGDLVTYAVPMIVGEIRRHLRDRARPIRPPRGIPASNWPEVLPLEGDEPFASEACSVDLERGEHRALLGAGLATLDDRERLVLTLRFYGDLSQNRIAAEIGLSQGHVSRLLDRSLTRLRAELGAP